MEPKTIWRIRHVDAGSCNACEQELTQLLASPYDMQQAGFDIVASPRHADALVVTGDLTEAMRPAVERIWQAMPQPKTWIAVGDCARGLAVWRSTPGHFEELGKPEMAVPGCPPTPAEIKQHLLKWRGGGQDRE